MGLAPGATVAPSPSSASFFTPLPPPTDAWLPPNSIGGADGLGTLTEIGALLFFCAMHRPKKMSSKTAPQVVAFIPSRALQGWRCASPSVPPSSHSILPGWIIRSCLSHGWSYSIYLPVRHTIPPCTVSSTPRHLDSVMAAWDQVSYVRLVRCAC